jgi:hypothetical protein
MIGENRQLVADEAVESEVQDFGRITDHFGGIYRMNITQMNIETPKEDVNM